MRKKIVSEPCKKIWKFVIETCKNGRENISSVKVGCTLILLVTALATGSWRKRGLQVPPSIKKNNWELPDLKDISQSAVKGIDKDLNRDSTEPVIEQIVVFR